MTCRAEEKSIKTINGLNYEITCVCIVVFQGVHLDDPLTPRKLTDATSEGESRFEEELFPEASSKCGHSSSSGPSMNQLNSLPTLTTQFHKKVTLTTHSNTGITIKTQGLEQTGSSGKRNKSNVAQHTSRAKSRNGNSRVMSPKDCDKSSSKMCQSDATNQQAKTERKSSELVQSSAYNPVSPLEKETKKSFFSFYLGETSNSSNSRGKVSTSSKTFDPVVVDKTELRRLSSAQEKSSRKGRFKKILHPLRRSQSAGNTKDVPAHALFLRHHTEMDPPRRKSQVSKQFNVTTKKIM